MCLHLASAVSCPRLRCRCSWELAREARLAHDATSSMRLPTAVDPPGAEPRLERLERFIEAFLGAIGRLNRTRVVLNNVWLIKLQFSSFRLWKPGRSKH